MATINIIGVPIPVDLPEFREDDKFLKKIKQLESFIEIKHDMSDAEEALKALSNSLKNENMQTISNLFSCTPWTISECILSYIVILYAKAFTEGTGRTRLDSQVKEIFKTDIDKHESIIELRNSFYAHQGIEANRHKLFYFPKASGSEKVRLNPDGFTTRIVMSKSFDPGKVEFCILRVTEYMKSRIDGLCRSIETELTNEQVKILNETPKEELMKNHWPQNSEEGIDPFVKRKT